MAPKARPDNFARHADFATNSARGPKSHPLRGSKQTESGQIRRPEDQEDDLDGLDDPSTDGDSNNSKMSSILLLFEDGETHPIMTSTAPGAAGSAGTSTFTYTMDGNILTTEGGETINLGGHFLTSTDPNDPNKIELDGPVSCNSGTFKIA